MSQPSDAASIGLTYFEPKDVQITRDSFGQLHVHVGDQHYQGVRPVRAFPLTAPNAHIAFLDAEGRQVGLVANMRALDRESRRILDGELEMMYFTPRVLAVLYARSQQGISTWRLSTDRGDRVVLVKDRSDVRTLADGRIIITDVHGIKYEIPDPRQLDERSQMFIEAET
ncbi:MAG: DUF1854 domain-containing protein [Armatimonadetes bacterium]|nr:DUF1854 domain-containing protein [Armatimonadota bacterium]